MMFLIDAYRFCDHMLADALTDKQKGKAEMVRRAVMTEPEIKAIPIDWIIEQIRKPENAGDKSRVLNWLLRKWEEE